MVEALWSAEFESSQGVYGAGVAIFETGRIFGGDSGYFYLGTFEIGGDKITGDLRVVHYHGQPTTTFGTTETDFQIKLEGQRSGDVIKGEMWREVTPEQRLPIILERRVDLP